MQQHAQHGDRLIRQQRGMLKELAMPNQSLSIFRWFKMPLQGPMFWVFDFVNPADFAAAGPWAGGGGTKPHTEAEDDERVLWDHGEEREADGELDWMLGC